MRHSRINTIKSIAYNIDPTRTASRVFKVLMETYPQFEYWSGSHNAILHHYGRHGLNVHTSEVLELGLDCFDRLQIQKDVDLVEYFYAALFHDTGKMFDYDMFGDQKNELGELVDPRWEPTEHRRLIHHLPRSVLIWHDIIKLF